MGNGNDYKGFDEYAAGLIGRKARQLVGRAGFVEADRHDLEQELVLDLLRRLPKFDPAKAKRETFISRLVEHRIATLVAARKAGVRDYRCRAGSLDEPGRGDDDTDIPRVLDFEEYRRETVDTARQDEDLRALRMDLERVLEGLPADLRALCTRLQTSSVAEISRETGVPRGTLYESIRKLQTTFDRAGVGAYLGASDSFRRAPVGTP